MYDQLKLINTALDRRFPNGHDVLLCALQVLAYYDAEDELAEVVAASIQRARDEGLLE